MKISSAARTYGNGFASVERREIAAQAFQAGINHERAANKMLLRASQSARVVNDVVRGIDRDEPEAELPL